RFVAAGGGRRFGAFRIRERRYDAVCSRSKGNVLQHYDFVVLLPLLLRYLKKQTFWTQQIRQWESYGVSPGLYSG
ncbi:unnamed protein product, partial [Ceratitis capitata]